MKPQKPQRSIRISTEEWNQFKVLCDANGATISEQIAWFIQRCIAEGRLPLTDDMAALSHVDKRASEAIDRLESRLDGIAEAFELKLTQALNAKLSNPDPTPEPSPKKRKPQNS